MDRCKLPEFSRLRTVRLLLLATTLALVFLRPAIAASATCALIGDSIAADLRPLLRECRFAGRIGIGTAAIVSLVPSNVGVIVVSAGRYPRRRICIVFAPAGTPSIRNVPPLSVVAPSDVPTIATAALSSASLVESSSTWPSSAPARAGRTSTD